MSCPPATPATWPVGPGPYVDVSQYSLPPVVTGVTVDFIGPASYRILNVPPTIAVHWDQSPDTNVLRYYVRASWAPSTTPEDTYWVQGISNTCCTITVGGGERWIEVQSFNPWHQSNFHEPVPFPAIPTMTNVVVIVTGSQETSPDLLEWTPNFEDPWVRTNPPGPGFFRGMVEPSITLTNF